MRPSYASVAEFKAQPVEEQARLVVMHPTLVPRFAKGLFRWGSAATSPPATTPHSFPASKRTRRRMKAQSIPEGFLRSLDPARGNPA